MLENAFICINPYLLTASVRNPTQKTVRKHKVNLSVQHNREGQFRINWLRESRCYQFSLSLRSLDAFLHVAGEIVAPKLISFTTPEQSKRCFGWIKWECPRENSDWPSFGHGVIPASVAGEWEVFDWPGWVTWPFLFEVGERWSQPFPNH